MQKRITFYKFITFSFICLLWKNFIEYKSVWILVTDTIFQYFILIDDTVSNASVYLLMCQTLQINIQ